MLIFFMLKFLIATLLLPMSLFASECPWLGKDARVLLSFDLDKSSEKTLSKTQVLQDLDCLKIILKNKYSAIDYFRNIDLLERIDRAKKSSESSSTTGLLRIIGEIHEGITDAHLSYSVYGGENLRLFTPKNNPVELKQDFPEEAIIENDKYTYFRPGFLDSSLSEGKEAFINYIDNNVKNLVIDLRGNGGGDDELAKQLVESLFTINEHVPSTEKIQIDSLFREAGFCISLTLHEYCSAADYCKDVEAKLAGKKISDVIPFTLSRYSQKFEGKRQAKFKSKIVLLIDSGCASSCETIVEKLSAHPNAILVGQNTMGALHFSNAVTFMLPNSGIITKVPTLFHKYEFDAVEGEGYPPSIRLDYIDLEVF
jgi:hypothetical protein